MFMLLVIFCIIILLVASIMDIKTREIFDYLSYTLVFVAIFYRAIYSAYFLDTSYLFSGLFGLGLAFLISLSLYYTNQWGGGDAKLLLGVGAVIGFDLVLLPDFLLFIFNMFLFGAIFGIFWTLFMSISKYNQIKNYLIKYYKQKSIIFSSILLFLISIVLLFYAFYLYSYNNYILNEFTIYLVLLSILSLFSIHIHSYVKAVEEICMIKEVNVKNVTEGDWIIEDIIYKNKTIAKKSDNGISKLQINELLKTNIKTIKIKEGIPFVPSFLIAYLVTIFVGNYLSFLF